jgi:hypothetical protein
MANTSGMMVQCMKASGSRIKLMAAAYMCGQMAENTTVNGKTTTCTARESTPGKMEECTRETTRMTESTATESTPGMMASSTKAGGKMANNTEKAYIEKTVVIVEESGRTVRESNGLMMSSGRICRMFQTPKITTCKAIFKTKREDTIN